MHLSLAYIGLVLAASAAAGSHHLAGSATVARLSARSDEVKGHTKENVQMKCFGGCNGFPTPPPTQCFNAPVICQNQGLPPMNTFFSTVQSYTVITTNTVQVWSGGIDPSQMVLQLQIMVVSLSTLFQSLQGGCPFQGNSQIFISTFAPMLVQIQTMITIISTQCGGNLGPFQQSFAVLSLIVQAIFGIGYSMQVNIQQFIQVSNFNPQPWIACGFPANNWINGIPGTFGGNGAGIGGGIGPQIFPNGNGGGGSGFPNGGGFPNVGGPIFPNGNNGFGHIPGDHGPEVHGGPRGGDPFGGFGNGSPGGDGGLIPGDLGPRIPGGHDAGPDGIPPFPGGAGGGGVIGFFQPLGLIGQLLAAIVNILAPVFQGLGDLLSGVGLLVGDLGHTVGHLLDGGGLVGGLVGGLI